MDTTIDLKKQLVKACKDLKNIDMMDKHRVDAYKTVVELSKEITKLDSKFEFDDTILINFKSFKPDGSKDVSPKVLWPKLSDEDAEQFGELEKHLEKLTALAVKITVKRLPREPQESPLFGQIISATVEKLIALEKH